MFDRLGAAVRRFGADCRGVTAILTALGATALIGFVGLGTDVALWELTKNKMQGAADQAAIAAVTAYLAGGGDDTTSQAKAITASYGFTDSQNGVTVLVNQVSPSPTGYDAAYTVAISQPQTLFFSSLFVSGVTVGATAEAATVSNGPCILALGTSGKDGLVASGNNTAVSLTSCDLDVNSSDSKAAETNGAGACIFAQNIYINGGSNPAATSGSSCTSGISYSGRYKSGTTTTDPYQYRTAPSAVACPANNTGPTHDPTNAAFVSYLGTYSPNTPTTVNPGTYCGDITVNAGASLTMNPGVYILVNGNFKDQGGGSVSGTGVTVYLTGSGNGYGTVTISGNSTITLTAPTSGETAGIVFWVDKNAPSNGKNNVTGGSTLAVTGAI
jgi:Flp pilus assembly protein TadG